MVRVNVPVVAEAVALRVSKLVVVVGLGLNEAETPLGRPEAERLTLPAKPFAGVMVTLLLPDAPCVMVMLVGEAERLKSGAGAEPGQLFTRLATLMVPMPVAKSHPVVVPNAG